MHSHRSDYHEWRLHLIHVIQCKFIIVNLERKLNISIYLSIYLFHDFHDFLKINYNFYDMMLMTIAMSRNNLFSEAPRLRMATGVAIGQHTLRISHHTQKSGQNIVARQIKSLG